MKTTIKGIDKSITLRQLVSNDTFVFHSDYTSKGKDAAINLLIGYNFIDLTRGVLYDREGYNHLIVLKVDVTLEAKLC